MLISPGHKSILSWFGYKPACVSLCKQSEVCLCPAGSSRAWRGALCVLTHHTGSSSSIHPTEQSLALEPCSMSSLHPRLPLLHCTWHRLSARLLACLTRVPCLPALPSACRSSTSCCSALRASSRTGQQKKRATRGSHARRGASHGPPAAAPKCKPGTEQNSPTGQQVHELCQKQAQPTQTKTCPEARAA